MLFLACNLDVNKYKHQSQRLVTTTGSRKITVSLICGTCLLSLVRWYIVFFPFFSQRLDVVCVYSLQLVLPAVNMRSVSIICSMMTLAKNSDYGFSKKELEFVKNLRFENQQQDYFKKFRLERNSKRWIFICPSHH